MSTITRVFMNIALKKSLIAFSKASKKSILTALKVLRNIAPKSNKAPITKLIGMVETNHPGVSLIKYIGRNISVKSQEKLIQNLVLNNQFYGEKWRQQAKEREKVQVPGFIVISPSYACNLNCVGCYAGEYGNKYHLEKELVFDIIKQANDLGIYFFTISGGEPFAWPPLLEMLETFQDSYFLIYTNGTLLTDDVCEKLSRLGNGSPAISIEGFEKETTDRRGEGMYETVMGAMQRLKKYGVFFGASVTHTRANHEAIVDEAFWQSLVDNGACYAWIFQYIPIGIKPNFELMPTPQQRKERYEITRKVRHSMPMLIADFWNDGSLVNGCMAGGAQYLHINAKGLVEPCVFQHFAVDDIRKKPLVEVLRAPFFKAIQQEIPYCENLLRPCMIIDHPEILKSMVEKYGAEETHDGAATIINELHEQLMDSAEEWRVIAEELWAKDYGYKKVPEKGIFTYHEEDREESETVS